MPLTPSGFNASQCSSQCHRTLESSDRHFRSAAIRVECKLGAAAEASGNGARLREAVGDLAGDRDDGKTGARTVWNRDVDGAAVAVKIERAAAVEVSGERDVSVDS